MKGSLRGSGEDRKIYQDRTVTGHRPILWAQSCYGDFDMKQELWDRPCIEGDVRQNGGVNGSTSSHF